MWWLLGLLIGIVLIYVIFHFLCKSSSASKHPVMHFMCKMTGYIDKFFGWVSGGFKKI